MKCFLSCTGVLLQARASSDSYYGKFVGTLDSQYQGIGGDVYAVDARTLFVKSFSYDGKSKGNQSPF